MEMDKIIISNRFFDGEKFVESPTFFKIKNGVIFQVGKFTDLKDSGLRFGKDVIVEDYRGLTLTPGLVDSHNHFTLSALKMRFQVNLECAKNFSDIKTTLLKQFRNNKRKWILGYNLNEYNLEEKKLPTAQDLDKISSEIPILITHSSEHYAICNSVALQKSNVTNETLNRFGSVIGRYKNGEPNGILYESAAMDIVKGNIPAYDLEEYEDALEYASRKYRKSGLTAVKDTGGTGKDIDEEKRVEALNYLSEDERLAIRVGIALPVYSLEDVRKKIELSNKIQENKFLRFVGFKFFIDGSGLSRTAWMKENWNKNYTETDESNFGKCLWDIEEFNNAISEVSKLKTTVSIHAIGDRGIFEALKAIKQNRGKNSKFSMIHCNAPNADDITKMAELGISVETQASFIYFIGAAYMSNFGGTRGQRLFPFNTMLKAGINVCNGSDSPVTRYEPIYGILSSMLRQTKYGTPPGFEYTASEKLDLEETLRTYTLNCSKSMEWEEIGNLKKGSFADVIVWKEIPENFNKVLDPEAMFHKTMLSGNSL
ncbi:amidohydrolase [Ferroplasma sp.]|uniref:amidohydrolase n=1 Tax=Ferroplasma sp. TaxID=2591003 RepID=UPI0026149902|nr:amidohydrolase [Ferroplasma sp.]